MGTPLNVSSIYYMGTWTLRDSMDVKSIEYGVGWGLTSATLKGSNHFDPRKCNFTKTNASSGLRASFKNQGRPTPRAPLSHPVGPWPGSLQKFLGRPAPRAPLSHPVGPWPGSPHEALEVNAPPKPRRVNWRRPAGAPHKRQWFWGLRLAAICTMHSFSQPGPL